MPAWACVGAIACFDVYNAVTRRVRHSFTPFFWLRRGNEFFHHLTTLLLNLLFICTVLYGLRGTRWRTNGWCPLLDHANKI
jgi:hypothetical protein